MSFDRIPDNRHSFPGEIGIEFDTNVFEIVQFSEENTSVTNLDEHRFLMQYIYIYIYI